MNVYRGVIVCRRPSLVGGALQLLAGLSHWLRTAAAAAHADDSMLVAASVCTEPH